MQISSAQQRVHNVLHKAMHINISGASHNFFLSIRLTYRHRHPQPHISRYFHFTTLHQMHQLLHALVLPYSFLCFFFSAVHWHDILFFQPNSWLCSFRSISLHYRHLCLASRYTIKKKKPNLNFISNLRCSYIVNIRIFCDRTSHNIVHQIANNTNIDNIKNACYVFSLQFGF